MATILRVNAVGQTVEEVKDVIIVVENILFVEPGYNDFAMVHFTDNTYVLLAYTIADFYTLLGGV